MQHSDRNNDRCWHRTSRSNGKIHRTDGPAIENSEGYQSWWQKDKLHRIDGPAIEDINGDKEWHLNGKLHRIDGPAIEEANGRKEWWLNGEEYYFAEWLKATPLSDKQKLLIAIEHASCIEEEKIQREYQHEEDRIMQEILNDLQS